jgi:hypothetical protein
MKHTFALALAAASCFSLNFGWQAALAQQAEYLPQLQNQAGAEQNPDVAISAPKAPKVLSDYQMQEQAIQKGLADNAAQTPKFDSYSPSTSPTWTDAPKAASVSKLKGMAAVAGHVLRRTAAVALPTAGVVLLSAALNRSAMGSMGSMGSMGRPSGFGGNQFGGNNFQQGYNPMNGFQNGAMSGYPGGMVSNYSNAYFPGR